VKIGPYIVDIFYQPSTFHSWGGSVRGVGRWSPNAKLLTFLVGNFTTVLYVFFKEDFSDSLILQLPLRQIPTWISALGDDLDASVAKLIRDIVPELFGKPLRFERLVLHSEEYYITDDEYCPLGI